MLKPLTKVKQFSNCTFSASLWTNGEIYFVNCYWSYTEEEIKELFENNAPQLTQVYELECTDKEEAIEAFIDIVQTLRKCAKYEVY